jgi:hypothetical protein
MWNWLNGTDTGRMVRSWLNVFVSTILVLFVTDGADIFAVDMTDAKAWLAAAFVAVLPLIVNYLNPRDTRYGRKEDEFV